MAVREIDGGEGGGPRSTAMTTGIDRHERFIGVIDRAGVISSNKKNGNYRLIGDIEDNNQLAYFDESLPCCGCGIGWFCLLVGFVFPLSWYYATILYLRNYYQKDPRERTGLAASAIVALIFTIALLIAIPVIFF